MSETLLEVAELHVAYGQVEAVRGVSLSVASGKIATVIGPNGAGKTTLLGAIMGLLPSHGVIRFAGERIDGRFTFVRPGHAINNMLLRALLADESAYMLTVAGKVVQPAFVPVRESVAAYA